MSAVAAGKRSMGAAIAFLLGILVSGCLRKNYEEIFPVHVDVLIEMYDKVTYAPDPSKLPRVRAHDLPQLLYPLNRADQFLRQSSGQKDRGSYKAFSLLVAEYRMAVDRIERARVDDATWTASRPSVLAARDHLKQLADTALAELRKENESS